MNALTRDLPLVPVQAALLIIDVQNYCCHRDGGEFDGLSADEFSQEHGAFFEQFERRALPNLCRLLVACRAGGVEVVYTVIEALTQDGRDRGLDYKITGFLVPKGSWDGQVLDAVAPVGDEIVLPKSASSVFNATHIEYVLRNMGITQIAMAGVYTDQCVETAVRDACDKGFLVTLVADACATTSQTAHDNSLSAMSGYCRTVTTDQIVAELGAQQTASLGD